ncbi:hypothetical protein RHMOL_Rhmol10G0215800 [Rhododendron molle]|uniref:Uncharacterized protein n=1 Tax=Rhododendron molle TaxID=49168 RepID=A0ACC0M5B0_RHOML|nr:hypothetical protein RHMOL_Rhmol10G0215800 [Rhododendron molle]
MAWEQANLHNVPQEVYITSVDSTNEWTQFQDNLATQMYNDWLAHSEDQVTILMESEGTSQSQPTSRKKKQDLRLWTFAEKETLLAAMMERISDKYRTHNGFKPNFFNEVEKELRKRLSGTTLKAQPNIESNVKN